MRTEATSVLSGRLPDRRTSDPYSLMPRAKDSAAPAVIAGARAGSRMRRSVVNRLAPSDEHLQHRLDRPHDEGKGHEQQGQEH